MTATYVVRHPVSGRARHHQGPPVQLDTRHLGFGGGPHACIGAALARIETRIAVTALLARYPWMELAVSEPSPIVGWTVRGVTSLPVNVG